MIKKINKTDKINRLITENNGRFQPYQSTCCDWSESYGCEICLNNMIVVVDLKEKCPFLLVNLIEKWKKAVKAYKMKPIVM